MRGQVRALEREIGMLKRAGIPTASAELRLAWMRAKGDDLCRECDALRQVNTMLPRGLSGRSASLPAGPSADARP